MYLTPLYLDGDLVAVDKPPGLSTHPTEADAIAASATELTRAALPGDGESHLGVHQRLDRETSGVVLFGRGARADRSLAAAFSGRAVDKVYLAVVYGCPARPEGTIEAALTPPDREGRVALARSGGGKEATTLYRVLETDRRHGVSVVEARPLTGRTHQVRAHLASLGCPVAGDALYDHRARPAPRLCLHAGRLALPHPADGRLLTIEAPPPPGLDVLPRIAAALALTQRLRGGAAAPGGVAGLAELLALAVARRAPLAAHPGTTVYRLVNGEGDGLPGMTVDCYGEALWVTAAGSGFWADGVPAVIKHLMGALAPRAVYLQAAAQDQRAALVAGAGAAELVVAEDSLMCLLRVEQGLARGLTPVLREVRAWVRRHAEGRTVLHVFASTCTLGVAAMAGGAARVHNLDAGGAALAWGKENYRINGFEPDGQDFIADDVRGRLALLKREGRHFDMVVATGPGDTSPPAWSAQRALAAATAALVSPGGHLVLCGPLGGMAATEFRRAARAGIGDAGRDGTLLATAGDPGVDYPRPPFTEGSQTAAVFSIGGDTPVPPPKA